MRRSTVNALRALIHAGVLTVLGVAGLLGKLHHQSLGAALGLQLVMSVAFVFWLPVIAAVIRRLDRRPSSLGPTLELAAAVPRHRHLALLWFAPVAVVPMVFFLERGPGRPPPWFVIVPIGLAAIAVLIVTWSYGVVIDGRARRLVRWRGVRIAGRGYPLFEQSVSVGTDASVVLDDIRRVVGKTGGYYTNEIALENPTVLLYETRNMDVARLSAEHVAKALGLDLVDRTDADNQERTRAVRELDLPLADQIRLRGVATARRPVPPSSRLILESADALPWVVRIQPRALGAGSIAVMAISAPFIYIGSLIPAGIIAVAAFGQRGEVAVALALVIALAFGWYVIWGPLLRSRREQQVIHLSQSGIRIARRAPGLSAGGQLAAEQIEEIVVIPNRGPWAEGLCVVARGDGVSLAFGHGLEREDALWLRDTAIAALAPRSIYR